MFPLTPAHSLAYGRLPDARFPFRDLISRWVALLLPPGGRRTDGRARTDWEGYATVRGTASLIQSERVRRMGGLVRLRPHLVVPIWKTHASKWDYIKGRFIITASRTARKSYEPPRAIFQQTKVIHITIHAVKRQYIWSTTYTY